jgi:hypothetical protein
MHRKWRSRALHRMQQVLQLWKADRDGPLAYGRGGETGDHACLKGPVQSRYVRQPSRRSARGETNPSRQLAPILQEPLLDWRMEKPLPRHCRVCSFVTWDEQHSDSTTRMSSAN